MYRMSLKHCFKYNKMGEKKDDMRQTMSSLLKIHSQYKFLGLGLIMIFLVKEDKFFSICLYLPRVLQLGGIFDSPSLGKSRFKSHFSHICD